ncbi:MAG: sugar ABC transporter permease [Azospirillaceae bacterium]
MSRAAAHPAASPGDRSAGPDAPPALGLWVDRHFRRLIVAPAVLVLLLIGLFPVVYSLIVSFQKINRRVEDTSFQGFDNYARLFGDDRFWESILHTGAITVIALPLELVLGLLLAWLFLEKLPGRQVFVALLLMPAVMAPFVAGAIWRLMFDNIFGPINQILGWIAGEPQNVMWLVNNDPFTVYGAILVCEVWQWTPFMFLILLAALSNVDRSLLEAAEIDGASGWRVFRRIVLPAIRPVVLVALTIRGLDLIRLFDIVWALTRGGPGNMTETVSVFAYVKGFERFDISTTAALTFVVIVSLSIMLFVLLRRVEIGR